MKSGSAQASDDLEPNGSQTGSDQANGGVENGFVKVHDARARQGLIESQSMANPSEIDNQLDLDSIQHMRGGSLHGLR